MQNYNRRSANKLVQQQTLGAGDLVGQAVKIDAWEYEDGRQGGPAAEQAEIAPAEVDAEQLAAAGAGPRSDSLLIASRQAGC